MKSVILVDPK